MQKEENKTQGNGSLVEFIIWILCTILMILAIIYTHTDNKNPKLNVLHFQKSKELICRTSLGGRASVLVNKQSGYTLYKGKYFKKGNELIDIEYCTQVED